MVNSMDWGSWGSDGAAGIEAGVLMVGLDAAGKTTILYKLKLGEGASSRGAAAAVLAAIEF